MGVNIGIGALICEVPTQRVAVGSLPEMAMLGEDELKFVGRSGIDTVGVFDHEDGTVAPAARATATLVSESPVPVDTMILVAPRSPDVLLGSESGHVQYASGLTGAFTFTVDGLGCTGSSAAWALARDLLLADPARSGVLITHASRPTGADRVRYPVTVIGDGAYAMTMVRGGRPVLRAHRMASDGRFHDLFTVDYRQAPWHEWREECASIHRYRFELALQSRLQLGRMVDEVLAEAGITKAQVAATLMQNVTVGAFQFYESMLGVPIHPVCAANLRTLGHLGAMDVVLNLRDLLSGSTVSDGDYVLVLNNSPVAAWAVTLWQV